MAPAPIDVWNIDTFDTELLSFLTGNAELIREYLLADQKIFMEYVLGRRHAIDHLFSRPKNVYAADFVAMRDMIGNEMESRTIRAWHYSRLTDEEVASGRR